MRERGTAKTIGLLIVALAVFSAVGYELWQPSIGWPDEARRVLHAEGGFSVVMPRGFEPHLKFKDAERSPDEVMFVSNTGIGIPALFAARRTSTDPDPSKLDADAQYARVTFQGQPAWERQHDMPHTHEHNRSLLFQRDGRWFELYAHVNEGQPLDRGAWAAYFASFKALPPRAVPNLAALAPATAPASGPPATSPATTPAAR